MILNAGAGIASFEGYGRFTSLAYEKKSCGISLRCFYNKQQRQSYFTGQGSDGYLHYNDRFLELVLLYGRCARAVSNKLKFSLALGPGIYKYTDMSRQSTVVYSNRTFEVTHIETREQKGLGLAPPQPALPHRYSHLVQC